MIISSREPKIPCGRNAMSAMSPTPSRANRIGPMSVLSSSVPNHPRSMASVMKPFMNSNRNQKSTDPPEVFGVEFGPSSDFFLGDGKIPTAGFGIFLLILVIVCCVGVMRLRRSRFGEQMLAVRANERAGAAVDEASSRGAGQVVCASELGVGNSPSHEGVGESSAGKADGSG